MSVDPSQYPAAPVASPATPTVESLQAQIAKLEAQAEQVAATAVQEVRPTLVERVKELAGKIPFVSVLRTVEDEGYTDNALVAVVEQLVKAVL